MEKILYGVCIGFAFAVGLVYVSLTPRTSTSITADDLFVAYQRGANDALNTNPPSEQLEYVCAGLWFNKEVAQR